MTSKQQEQYERSLQAAKRNGLEVVAHGTRKSDGAAVYCVPSKSERGRWHVVIVEGAYLHCDCTAAQHGKYCCHRAAVRARIILEGQFRRDAKEREIERAFHAAARALNVTLQTAPGTKARPLAYSDNRPVSIFR